MASPVMPLFPVAPRAPVAPVAPAGPAGPAKLSGSGDRATGSVVAHPTANVATTASSSGRFIILSSSIEFFIAIPLV
jgi:hypothetical protein